MQYIEDFYQVDELHHQMAFSQIAAVDVLAVLDPHVLTGVEG